MQIDIATHIEKLLFLHDALTIPGFGAFSARPAPASTDYVGGTVAPPSKSLTFNENITTDDGLLVQDVAKTYGMNTEDARKSVGEFVDNMQDLLNRREIVTLRGVGRLYKNYVQKIQFLPDTTNFNPESFGLPPLQFHPIARSREVVTENKNTTDEFVSTVVPPTAPAKTETITEVATPAVADVVPPAAEVPPPAAPVTVETTLEKRGNEFVPVLITVLILLLLAAAYWAWKRQKAAPKVEDPVVSLEDKGPKQEKTVAIPKAKEPEPEVIEPEPKVEPAKTASQSASEKMNEARNALKGKKDGRECILIVATLQEKNNADRLRSMLRKARYEVYEVRKGGFQIGVKFYYNNIKEVQDKMLSISKLTGEKQIWIKKK